MKLKFEMIHYKSYGHPFYQHELAQVKKNNENIYTLFICPSFYPYKDVVQFIQMDFPVFLLPKIIFKLLIKLRIIRQRLVICQQVNYSKFLDQYSSSSALKFYSNQFKIASDIIICERVSPSKITFDNGLQLAYQSSARDFERQSCGQIETIAKSFSLDLVYSNFSSKKSTIQQIAESNIYFGTNCGPYVCAQSLRKTCFLINTIPFFGTNSYHKSTDYHLPALLICKKSGEYISLQIILSEKLYLLDEQQLSMLNISVEALPWWLINECWDEFLQNYIKSKIRAVDKIQLSIQDYIYSHCDAGSVPLWPKSFILHTTQILKLDGKY